MSYHIDDFGITGTVKDTYVKYQSTIITAITTACLLLISLAWNDVIQTTIEKYYPHKDINTIKGKVSYAVIITTIVVLMEIYVFPYIEKFK